VHENVPKLVKPVEKGIRVSELTSKEAWQTTTSSLPFRARVHLGDHFRPANLTKTKKFDTKTGEATLFSDHPTSWVGKVLPCPGWWGAKPSERTSKLYSDSGSYPCSQEEGQTTGKKVSLEGQCILESFSKGPGGKRLNFA